MRYIFYNVSNLSKVLHFMKNNKDKIILATGDIDQLESIDIVSNVKNMKNILIVVLIVFFLEIFLKENKRLKSEEDKVKLKNMKYDILKTNVSVIDIINKYKLKTTDKIITEDNIAYTNSKCNQVSQQVRKMLGKQMIMKLAKNLKWLPIIKMQSKTTLKLFLWIRNMKKRI